MYLIADLAEMSYWNDGPLLPAVTPFPAPVIPPQSTLTPVATEASNMGMDWEPTPALALASAVPPPAAATVNPLDLFLQAGELSSLAAVARPIRPLPRRRKKKAAAAAVDAAGLPVPTPAEKRTVEKESKEEMKTKKKKKKRTKYKGPLPQPLTRGQTLIQAFVNNFEIMDEVISHCGSKTKTILMRVNKALSLHVGDQLYKEIKFDKKLKLCFQYGLTKDTIMPNIKRSFERYTKVYRLVKITEVLYILDHSRKLCQVLRSMHKLRLHSLRPSQLRQLRAVRIMDINGACGGHYTKDSTSKQPRVTGSCHFWHVVRRQVDLMRWHNIKDLAHVQLARHAPVFELLINKYLFVPPRVFDIILDRRAVNVPIYPIDAKDGPRLNLRLHITGRVKFRYGLNRPYEVLYPSVKSDDAMIPTFVDTLSEVLKRYRERNVKIQVIGLGRLKGPDRDILEHDEMEEQTALLENLEQLFPDVQSQVKFLTRQEAHRNKIRSREVDHWYWEQGK